MEIEAKLKVESHDAIRERLRDNAARFGGRYRELNHIFDQPRLELRRSGQALRVRELHALDGAPRPATITYKGTIQPDTAFKTRPEIEIDTAQPGRAIELFEALGFERLLVFEKIRESWEHGGCQVELDELPHIGCFIEIEGPSEAAIRRVMGALGVDGEHISRSYVAMLLSYCKAAGLSGRDVRF